MIGLIILGLLAAAGWMRLPWWSPLAVFACALPVTVWRVSKINENREMLGLDALGNEVLISSALPLLAMSLAAYWLGRGARRALSGKQPPYSGD